MQLGLGLGFTRGPTGIPVTATIDGAPPWTITAPTGYVWVAGSVTLVIPAESGTYGTSQEVAATLTAAGVLDEAVDGTYATALAAAGYVEGDSVTITVRGAALEPVVFDIMSLLPVGRAGLIFDDPRPGAIWQDVARTLPVTADGQTVASWRYRQADGVVGYATQATPGSRPTYHTDGVLHWLSNGLLATPAIDLTATNKMTIVAAVRKVGNVATGGLILEASANTNAATGAFFILPGHTSNGFGPYYGSSFKGTVASTCVTFPTTFTAPISNVVTAVGNIGTDLNVLRVNGATIMNTNTDLGTGNFGNHSIYIGNRANGSLPFDGNIYGLAIIGEVLADNEIENAEQWGAEKAGITFSSTFPNPQAEIRTDIAHVLSYGQSLSLGIGTGYALTTTQRFDNLKFVGGVRAQDAGGGTAPRYGYLAALTETGPGAETAFETPMGGATDAIKELVESEDATPYAEQTFQLLASAPGAGGVTIAQLSKPGAYYSRFMEDVTYGLSNAQAVGKGYKVPAFFWTQGESDGLNTGYASALAALRADIDADVKAITGQTDDVWCISYQTPRAAMANRYIDAMATDSKIRVACPIYHLPPSDGVHRTAQSSKIMGAYYGVAYKRLVIDGVDWKPVMPLSHSVAGNVVEVQFNVNGTALEFDTTLYAAQSGYGFRLYAPGGTELPVSSVDIISSNTVRVTAVSAIPAGAVLKYGTTESNPLDAAAYDILGGNLRDNAGDVTVFDGGGINYPMHNWCLLFELTL